MNCGACRDCAAPIVFARNEAGTRVALDPQPSPDGDSLIVTTATGKLLVFRKRFIFNAGYCYGWHAYGNPLDGTEWFGLYERHATSCPEAGEEQPGS